MTGVKVTEGEVDFSWPAANKPCKTWYRIHGELSSGMRPLVMLHGGPGMASDYLFPLADLVQRYNFPVIFYDQIGTGRSTHLPEFNGKGDFWTPELFVTELDNLLDSLKLREGGYNVYGQSWGGMFASLFASKRPHGLHKVIISNSPASIKDWIKSCNEWRAQLPQDVQDVLDKHEADGTTDSKDYEKAVFAFYERHLCRAVPWDQHIFDTLEWLNKDPTVYHTMNGPSEFHVIGSLKDWSTAEASKNINVPTLLINAEFDEGKDYVSKPFFENIPRVKWITFGESSHLPMYEKHADRYREVIADFLKG